jgi:hypothetical protein
MKVGRYILESYNKAKEVISSCQSFEHKESAGRYIDNFVKLYSPYDDKKDTLVRLMYKQLKRDLQNKRI